MSNKNKNNQNNNPNQNNQNNNNPNKNNQNNNNNSNKNNNKGKGKEFDPEKFSFVIENHIHSENMYDPEKFTNRLSEMDPGQRKKFYKEVKNTLPERLKKYAVSTTFIIGILEFIIQSVRYLSDPSKSNSEVIDKHPLLASFPGLRSVIISLLKKKKESGLVSKKIKTGFKYLGVSVILSVLAAVLSVSTTILIKHLINNKKFKELKNNPEKFKKSMLEKYPTPDYFKDGFDKLLNSKNRTAINKEASRWINHVNEDIDNILNSEDPEESYLDFIDFVCKSNGYIGMKFLFSLMLDPKLLEVIIHDRKSSEWTPKMNNYDDYEVDQENSLN